MATGPAGFPGGVFPQLRRCEKTPEMRKRVRQRAGADRRLRTRRASARPLKEKGGEDQARPPGADGRGRLRPAAIECDRMRPAAAETTPRGNRRAAHGSARLCGGQGTGRPTSRAAHGICRAREKKKRGRGPCGPRPLKKTGGALLSRGQIPQYPRRWGPSLPCSGWERVFPPLSGRRQIRTPEIRGKSNAQSGFGRAARSRSFGEPHRLHK